MNNDYQHTCKSNPVGPICLSVH